MIKLKTLSRDRKYTARLENAYKVTWTKQTNSLWTAAFRLPLNDPKNDKVRFFGWVEIYDGDDYVGLFRVMPKKTVKNRATNEVSYECEHALGTLLDKSLFKYHQLENYTTTAVLQYLINQQHDKNWKLGKVDFTRYFHYAWENEALLGAFFSVPKPFDEQYRWDWDTTSYPWTLSLIKPEIKPVCRIKEGHNLIGLEIYENPYGLYNRIYPLGAGEGVNQLDIKKINKGVPYIENKESIAKYGLHEYIWADKRYTIVENLKSSAESLLARFSEPIVSWDVRAAAIAKLSGLSVDKFEEGKIVRLVTNKYGTIDLRILRVQVPDAIDTPGEIDLTIGNMRDDLSTTSSDLERRQQINELYSQGATNILKETYADNCDERFPAVMEFNISQQVVNVNAIMLNLRTKPFRAYSKAVKGGGAQVGTTSAGGGSTQTSSSGGGSSQTSSSGGGSSQTSSAAGQSTSTSSAGGVHRHLVASFNAVNSNFSAPKTWSQFIGADSMIGGDFPMWLPYDVRRSLYTAGSSDAHSHTVTTPAHTHSVSIPAHNHSVSIPSHTHSVNTPSHTHQITLPNHTHELEYGIFEDSNTANKITLKVDGKTVPGVTSTSISNLDLLPYLSKDDSGNIQRGNHKIEVLPNKRARIETSVDLFVFIRSQLGVSL